VDDGLRDLIADPQMRRERGHGILERHPNPGATYPVNSVWRRLRRSTDPKCAFAVPAVRVPQTEGREKGLAFPRAGFADDAEAFARRHR